jgi:hypothetical protein
VEKKVLSVPKNVLKKILPSSLMALSAVVASVWTAAPAQAFQIFFGADPGLGPLIRPTKQQRPNSEAARNQFLSNLAQTGTEDFESFTPGCTNTLPLSFPSTSVTGKLQSDTNGCIFNIPTGTNQVGRYPISGNQYLDIASNFSISFSQPVQAFGFYAVDVGDALGQLTLKTANGTRTTTLPISNPFESSDGSVFYYGLIAENPNEFFTQITFNNSQAGIDFFGFDDLTIGSRKMVQAPEPGSTSALAALMVTGIGWHLVRKRR